jgi:hypothetical protein
MRNPWKVSTLALVVLLSVVIGRSAIHTASAEPQPHMQSALDSLNAALGDLEKATADKGGHRAKALSLTKQAVAQVKKGIEYDNKHK